MKKYINLFILIICNILLISTCFSGWVMNAEVKTDNSIAFENSGGIIENYNVNGTTEESTPYAKFTTLEDAVRSANAKASGTTKVNMYLTVGSFIDVKNQKNLTFNSGVSLYLPYEGKKYDITSDSEVASLTGSFVDANQSGINNNLKSSLNLINSQIIINSGAKVFIGGKYGEKGVCGLYTQINLDQNSNITVNGELHCNGYIKEVNNLHVDQDNREDNDLYFNSFDLKRYIYVKSGGTFYTPIIFYDGGSLSGLTGLNGKGVFPLNVFDFPNTQTYLRIYTGAKFYATVRMTKTVADQTINVNEKLLIVKPSTISENSLLTLSGNSDQEYISFEYCPMKSGFTSNDASKTYIVINGTATVGYLTITVRQQITTQDKFLPISYKLQLIIGSSGNITTTYKIKFMGGSQLKVLSGGTFINSSEVIGYKANSAEGITDYPTTYGDSRFIIDGTFEMSNSAKLGAHFTTRKEDNSAIINLTNVAQSQLNCTSIEGLAQTPIAIYSTADFYDSENSAIVSKLLKAGNAVHSDIQGNICFESNGSLTSYLLTIHIAANNYEYPLVGYQVYQVDSSGNEIILSTKDIYMNSEGTYLIEAGYRFKVISLSRAEKTEFTGDNNSREFISGTIYDITNDTEITITPGKGIPVRFSSDGESGNGGATYTISESLTENGTYYQIGSSIKGKPVSVAVKEGAYVQFVYTQGQCKGTIPGDHYKFSGIVSVPASTNGDNYKQNGEKLTTTIHDVGSLSSATSGGSTSTSKTQINASATIHAYIENRSGGGCFTKGTLVMMADGMDKKIEDIKVGDIIKTFNHEKGVLENQFITYIPHHEENIYNVLELSFDNGKIIKVLFAHGFMNCETKKYEEISYDNVSEKIGNKYLFIDKNSVKSESKLVSYRIYQELTECYSVSSAYNLNHIVDGALCISDDIQGLYNYFELNDDYKYDQIKKQQDIDKYGLLEYEEVSYFMSREIYDLFNVKYLGVSIGKGLITIEIMEEYISKFA